MSERKRQVVFEGARNFRDVGGYATAAGGTTRWGRVYRADGLHRLTDADLERYDRLGIRAVYDLRGDSERDDHPNRVESSAISIISAVNRVAFEPPALSSMVDARSGEQMLCDMYGRLLSASHAVIGRIFRDLADPTLLPAVFHCHAGKDRTGFVAVMLLEALGVHREVVLDDYELTAEYLLREHQDESYEQLVAGGMVAEAAAGVLGAPRWVMADTLERLDDEFGGIERYLRDRAGLDDTNVARLRRELVEGAV